MRGLCIQFAWLLTFGCGLGLHAAEAPSSQVRSLVDEGVGYARQGRLVEAEAAYRRALAIDPHCSPAQVNLGLAYFKAGDYPHAVTPLRQAASEGVDTDQIHTLLGMAFYALHQYSAASREYEILFQREPGNVLLQYFLAESYTRSHQSGARTELLQRMQTATPDSPVIYMLAGEQYDRLGQQQQASAEFLKAAAAAPNLPMVHFALGYLYWEQHLNHQAQAEFEVETHISGGEVAQAKGFLGDIALHAGEDAPAQSLLVESVAADPQVRIAQFDLGVLSAKKHEYGAAMRYFKTAIVLDPQQPDGYYRLALLYREQGMAERERAMLAKVRQLHQAERTTIADAMAAPKAANGAGKD